MQRLIGLTGYPGHGKTTCAKYLAENHGQTRMRFAGVLKSMLLQMEGVTVAHVDGDLKNEPIPALGYRSARYAMEHLGTSWGRDLLHPDLWLMQTRAAIDAVLAEGGSVVLDDVRFVNEAELIQALGGVVIRVTRPGEFVDMTLPANQQIAAIKPNAEVLSDAGVSELRGKVVTALRALETGAVHVSI